MPYTLEQVGQTNNDDSSMRILLIIGLVVILYFLLVQTNLPKTVMDMLRIESFINPESTTADELNRRSSPAVDLSAPGVPYQSPPARLGYSSSKMSSMSPKSTPSSTPKSSPSSTPKSSPRSTPKSSPRVVKRVVKSSPRSTPKSSPRSTPKSSPRSTPKSSPRSTPRVVKRVVKSSPKSTPSSSRASSPIGMSLSKSSTMAGKMGKDVKSKDVKSKKIEKYTDVNKLYSTRDGYDLKVPVSKSVCSQKCCGYYWKENMDGLFKKNDPVKWSDVGVGKKYRTSNVTCMGDGVAPPGCRCYTGAQYELLATRAGNGSREY